MTRRDWWIGIGVLGLIVALYAAFPRYEVRFVGVMPVRVDRWTGTIGVPPVITAPNLPPVARTAAPVPPPQIELPPRVAPTYLDANGNPLPR